MTMRNRDHIPPGWGPRILRQAGVPYSVIFNFLSQMYESQVRVAHLWLEDPIV